jgi:hypothetical protein
MDKKELGMARGVPNKYCRRKDRKGCAMKKILGIVVLFAFIFSSCATAPNSTSVVNHKNKNTVTFAVKGFERFGFLDLKASDPTDEEGSGTKEKSSFDIYDLMSGVLVVGGLALGGWGIYKMITDPDSLKTDY